MAATADSRVTLSNLDHDLRHDRIRPHSAVADLVAKIEDEWSKVTVTGDREIDAELAKDALERALEAAGAAAFCKGPAIDERPALSRISDEDTVWQWLVHKSAKTAILDGEEPDEDAGEVVMTLKREDIIPGATLRGGKRNFAWVTRADELAAVRRFLQKSRRASRIRSFLGLAHYNVGQSLVEIVYPEYALADQVLAAPNVLDGGSRSCYRSRVKPDKWGRALDLESTTFEDGGVEAVHHAIPLTEHFSIRFLGVVEAPAPTVAADKLDGGKPRDDDDLDRIRSYGAPK